MRRIVLAQLGLDDEDGHQRTDGRDQEGRGDHEIPVRGRDHDIVRVDQPRSFLGDPRQQRVNGSNEDIGAIATGHTGKGRCHTGQRMPTQRVEDRSRQRDQHHIADLGRRIGDDTGKDDGNRHDMARRRQHHGAHGSGQQAGLLGHSNTQHRHQHHAQRCKTGEIGHQAGPDATDPVPVHQADRPDHAVFSHAASTGWPRILNSKPEPAEQSGQEHDTDRQDGKEGHRVRQEIAEPFDAVKKAREGAAALGFRRRYWFGHLVPHFRQAQPHPFRDCTSGRFC